MKLLLNMVKKIQKIVYIVCILQISFLFFMSITLNATAGDNYLRNIEGDINNWEGMGQNQMNNIGIEMSDLLEPVLGIAQILTFAGFVASIAGTLYLSTKWLLNANKSPDELQKVKHQTFGLLVSAIICLGAYNIWKMLIETLSDLR